MAMGSELHLAQGLCPSGAVEDQNQERIEKAFKWILL